MASTSSAARWSPNCVCPAPTRATRCGGSWPRPPIAGSTPIFLGDDVTDEAGFAAVAELGGWGVHVGDVPVTAARYQLDDVTAVHNWLGRIAGASA